MFGIIISAVIIFIALLLYSHVRICIVYEDTLKAYLKLFGIFRIRLYPKRKPKRYISARKMRALGRKTKRTKKKKNIKKTKKEAPDRSRGIGETVGELYNLISVILRRFAYRVKLRIRKLDIRVATEDAAKTALAYAGVCNTLGLLTEMLSGYDKLKCSIDSMSCQCDFTAESFGIDADIEIRVRIYHVLSSVMGIIIDTSNMK